MTDADPREEVDTLRSRLRNGERYVQFEADRDHLVKMSDNIRLVPSEIGDHRHLKLLRHCSRMAQLAEPPTVDDFKDNDEADRAGVSVDEDVEDLLEEHGLLGLALEYRAATEALVRWINDEYSNEHTNQDYRTALRSFGRYRGKLDDPPESLAWIPTGTSNDFNPVPSERDLLTHEEDIQPMLEVCHNPRDKALIAVQFEAGLRGGELYDLRVGDVFDSEHSVGVHVDGKEGERTVHLINSIPYLQRWLGEHPAREDDQCYLWSKLNAPERPSYTTFLNYFKDAAGRAGVSKEVTPTNFRKSNTRWLVLLGFSQARIEDRQGRKRGSEHTARYLARFGDESNERAYAKLHGVEVEDDDTAPDEMGPIECPRCHRETPRERDFCMWCDGALNFEATEQLDDVDDEMAHSIAGAADGDVEDLGPEEILELREEVEDNPALKRLLASLL